LSKPLVHEQEKEGKKCSYLPLFRHPMCRWDIHHRW